MKLYNKLITFLVASSVLVYTIPLKRRDPFQVSEKCSERIDKSYNGYDECSNLFDTTISNYENNCRSVNSEECKKYYFLKLSETPECDGYDKANLKILEQFVQLSYITLKMHCVTDENDKQCPLYDITDLDEFTDSWTEEKFKAYTEKHKNDTCKSKKCTQGLIDTIEENRTILAEMKLQYGKSKGMEEMDESLVELQEFFKSESCKAQNGSIRTTQANNNQSDTFQAGITQVGNTQIDTTPTITTQPGTTQPETTQDGNGLATNNATVNNQTATNNSTNTQTSAAASRYKISHNFVTALVLVAFNFLL